MINTGVNLNLLKYVCYVNNCISNDFDLSVMNKIHKFTNNLDFNVNDDFDLVFNDEIVTINLGLRHSTEDNSIIFSDFYYEVNIKINNNLTIYCLNLQSWGEDMQEHNTIEYIKTTYNTITFIDAPSLIEKEKSLPARHFDKEVLRILENHTGEFLTYIGTDDFPYSTLMREESQLVGNYQDGKIQLAENNIIFNNLKIVDDEFVIIDER